MLKLPKRKWVKITDKNFLTTHEIALETGESLVWAQRLMKEMVRTGRWEVRWKRINGRPIMAVGHD